MIPTTNLTTFHQPQTVKAYYSNSITPSLEEKSIGEFGAVKIYFISAPTPLNTYADELRKAGYSEEHIQEIIEGLSESPLYEGTQS